MISYGDDIFTQSALIADFAIVPPKYVSLVREKYFFYIWNKENSEVRWMASLDTIKGDVKKFVTVIVKTIRSI